jgi:hypothetical protein
MKQSRFVAFCNISESDQLGPNQSALIQPFNKATVGMQTQETQAIQTFSKMLICQRLRPFLATLAHP